MPRQCALSLPNRLMEGLRLRVKDVDLAYYQITVRDGMGISGSPCRITVLCQYAINS
jgi:hypothetical protein